MRPALVLIAAVAEDGVIGNDNRLLWRLRSDLQRFKAMTLGKPLIMGRKTFESIGKPLPGRTSIILTRDTGFSPPAGCLVAASVEDSLALAEREAHRLGATEIMVAGGGEIYAQLIDRADRLEITEVALSPAGDARFPPISARHWREASREPHAAGPGDEAPFAFVTYTRGGSAP